MPALEPLLDQYANTERVFELGCGNGSTAAHLQAKGYSVTGIDPSASGLAVATERGLDLHQGSTEEDLAARYGKFPVVISLEVVEHVFSPKLYAERIHDLLEPGGVAIISTPYHGYLKNLALAVTGKMDGHFTALWEGGHIKFFSRDTLGTLFQRVGMEEVDFRRVGRIPQLAKSMIGVYRKAG
ncbi:class I SAM-dependent methyltransferase [Erythrobacter alti]|uniref:class I SAM-dependent methyltransferase n=1 Tax=Erythrobacter alti TaxID=1896145 RepID=UPI0030F3DBCF